MAQMSRQDQYAEVVLIVKQKNKRITNMDQGGLTDDEILFRVKEVEQSILNYCQIPRVPVALNYVWANMSVDLILYDIEMNYKPDDLLEAMDVSDISTIKVGDTSIYVGDRYRSNLRSRILQSHNANLDEIIMSYTKQLNQFRRIF